jgi:hypothetical protein
MEDQLFAAPVMLLGAGLGKAEFADQSERPVRRL